MSTTPTPRRIINLEAVKNILSRRATVDSSMDGLSKVVTIQGDGNFVAKGQAFKDGTIAEFSKTIYNLECTSAISLNSAEAASLLKEAITEEQAGNADKAAELYNQFLNFTQMSVNVIEPGPKFHRGDDVKVKFAVVTTKAGTTQIVANRPSLVVPTAAPSQKFTLDSLVALTLDK